MGTGIMHPRNTYVKLGLVILSELCYSIDHFPQLEEVLNKIGVAWFFAFCSVLSLEVKNSFA